MIRKLQFKTNLLGEKIETLSSEYSVLGYYDGLTIEKFPDCFSDNCLSSEQGGKELYNSLDIIGMRQETDEEFWKKGGKPYIFITCLRLKRASREIKLLMEELERSYDSTVCYLTVDSSDLVICLRSRSYLSGYRTVVQYDKVVRSFMQDNEVQTSFSAVAIWQEVLNGLKSGEASAEAKAEIDQIEEEKLSALLRANVKNWGKFGEYVSLLEDEVGKSYKNTVGILGSEDAVIELENLDSKKFLKLFAREELLTHGNEYYRAGLLNIRTELTVEILFEKKGLE